MFCFCELVLVDELFEIFVVDNHPFFFLPAYLVGWFFLLEYMLHEFPTPTVFLLGIVLIAAFWACSHLFRSRALRNYAAMAGQYFISSGLIKVVNTVPYWPVPMVLEENRYNSGDSISLIFLAYTVGTGWYR